MLVEMRIRGLGVIDDATLELGPGLTVVTGETGAGKTMVVSGLTLLLGGRGDAGLVRSGGRHAVVEGRLLLPEGAPALARAREAGADLDDDGSLLVSRTVGADGRSRAHVGGRSVPVGLLGELAEDLVTVHGQSDQLRLLRPARQREALDRYAGEPVAGLLARHRALYAEWRAAADDLRDRTERARERAQEEALLRHGLAEVDAAEPVPGEDADLAAEAERLTHVDALRLAALGAHAALAGDLDGGSGDGDVTALLAGARRSLDGAAAHDEALAALGRRVDELGYLAADVAGDLASYAERLDADPERLARVHERRAVLGALTRRYGDTVDEVLAWAAAARARLDELDSSADTLAALAGRRDALGRELAGVTDGLTAARTAAAERFGRAVTAELTGLAMPHAAVEVALSRRGDVGPDGADEVELLLRPHRGAPARPVQRGASGGELSRVMLAVEVVFAGADEVPTRVFDEVDAGVGGRAAVEVGRRLARLAGNHQVLVVTHLPQVAAFADRHLAVRKDDDGTVGRSGVTLLEGSDRVRELSRMLAGLDDSDLAAGHAQELLAAAAADRSAADPSAADRPAPAAAVSRSRRRRASA